MNLNQLRDRAGVHKRRRRIGRGIGSGRGKTASRGHKGQKSRTGKRIGWFEGGQMPLTRRLPKAGFTNALRRRYEELNLDRLQRAVDEGRLDAGAPVALESLRRAGLVHGNRDGVRLLGRGELKAKLDITVDGASKSAEAAVAKAGGRLTRLIAPRAERPKRKRKAAQKSKKKMATAKAAVPSEAAT
jgi:large subunit ribosomal protein L15